MEDLQVPLHRSLAVKILFAGVPREVGILNGTLCAAIVLGGALYWMAPVFLALHLVFVRLTKIDEYFFDIFRGYMKQKDLYEP